MVRSRWFQQRHVAFSKILLTELAFSPAEFDSPCGLSPFFALFLRPTFSLVLFVFLLGDSVSSLYQDLIRLSYGLKVWEQHCLCVTTSFGMSLEVGGFLVPLDSSQVECKL